MTSRQFIWYEERTKKRTKIQFELGNKWTNSLSNNTQTVEGKKIYFVTWISYNLRV